MFQKRQYIYSVLTPQVIAQQTYERISPTSRKQHRRTVSIAHVSRHLAYNNYVHSGYRPFLNPIDSLASVFSFHNELLNIWSHLLMLIVMIFIMSSELTKDKEKSPWVTFIDVLSVITLSCSVVYHTFMASTRSESEYRYLLQIDLLAICFLNAGALISLVYQCLHCYSRQYPVLFALLVIIPNLFTLVSVIAAQSARARAKAFSIPSLMRLMFLFIFPFLKLSAPNISSPNELPDSVSEGDVEARLWEGEPMGYIGSVPFPYELWSLHISIEILLVIGGIINVQRFPERNLRKYSVNLDFFNSHTIMHILVGISMVMLHFLTGWRAELVALNDRLGNKC